MPPSMILSPLYNRNRRGHWSKLRGIAISRILVCPYTNLSYVPVFQAIAYHCSLPKYPNAYTSSTFPKCNLPALLTIATHLPTALLSTTTSSSLPTPRASDKGNDVASFVQNVNLSIGLVLRRPVGVFHVGPLPVNFNNTFGGVLFWGDVIVGRRQQGQITMFSLRFRLRLAILSLAAVCLAVCF